MAGKCCPGGLVRKLCNAVNNLLAFNKVSAKVPVWSEKKKEMIMDLVVFSVPLDGCWFGLSLNQSNMRVIRLLNFDFNSGLCLFPSENSWCLACRLSSYPSVHVKVTHQQILFFFFLLLVLSFPFPFNTGYFPLVVLLSSSSIGISASYIYLLWPCG